MAAAADAVTIRVATAADVPSIHRLLTELAAATGLSHKFFSSEDDLRRHGFGVAPLFESLLAVDRAGAAVGLALFFYSYSSWRGEPGVYLQDLVVSRAARGQGLGRGLLRATARHASRRGVTHLRLAVEHDNVRAIAFYESLGLRQCQNECLFEASDRAFHSLAAAS
jgi:ribosomal protein S18 acetylase RimI-like enzyme